MLVEFKGITGEGVVVNGIYIMSVERGRDANITGEHTMIQLYGNYRVNVADSYSKVRDILLQANSKKSRAKPRANL
jgi:hypothetical protein